MTTTKRPWGPIEILGCVGLGWFALIALFGIFTVTMETLHPFSPETLRSMKLSSKAIQIPAHSSPHDLSWDEWTAEIFKVTLEEALGDLASNVDRVRAARTWVSGEWVPLSSRKQ